MAFEYSRKKKHVPGGRYVDHERLLFVPRGRQARLRIGLVFPNTYAVGMSNLGFQLVYRFLAAHPEVHCERFFLPDSAVGRESVRSQGVESIESGSHPGSFDCLAFSLSFESDYLNVVRLLAASGIDPLRRRRQQDVPLLLAGGVAVCMNPEPLADLFDLFVVGEAESVLPDVVSRALACLRPGRARRLRADDFEHIGGIYIPGRVVPVYEGVRMKGVQAGLPVAGRRPHDLDACHGSSCVLTPCTQFSGMALVEVSRGCPRQCRFCAAGCLYAPYRMRSLDALTAAVQPFLENGVKIGLLGAAVADYPALEQLMRAIVQQGGGLSISSLRADALTPEMVELLAACGHSTFTIAPEAATLRLRNVLGKNMSDEAIMRAVDLFAYFNIPAIRLYFMIGLPGERDEDIDAIADMAVELCARYRAARSGRKHLRRLTLSISPFVPKPFTPFQWHAFEPVVSLKKKLDRIRQALRGAQNITVAGDSPRMSLVQAVLSTGDRRLADVLLHAYDVKGNWAQAFRRAGVDPGAHACRQRSVDEILPWDVLRHNVEKHELWRQYLQTLGS